MPRNELWFVVDNFVRESSTDGLSYENHYNDPSTWTGRADSESTKRKRNGAFYLPTGYWGHFYYGSGRSFEYTFEKAFTFENKKYTLNGTTPVGAVCATALWNYGVTSVGLPYLPIPLQSIVASKIRRKIDKDQWNLGQDLAEARESINFVIDEIKGILGLLRALSSPDRVAEAVAAYLIGTAKTNRSRTAIRRERARLIRESVSAPASVWLAYQFAWLPLLSSIHSAMAGLRPLLEEGVFRATASAEDDDLPEPGFPVDGLVVSSSWRAKRELEMSVAYAIDRPFLQSLDSLGLTDPLAIAWELVPLSFVVDWFIPIGNFLSAISRPMGMYYLNGYQTSYLEWELDRSVLLPYTENQARGLFPRYTARRMSFRRDLLLGFPIPIPYFRGFGNAATGNKLVSLMAIAVQKIV